MADGIYLPLIVEIEGEAYSAGLMSRKAFSKSIESKVLWIVHPETERVIPWNEEPFFISLIETDGFYKVELPAGSSKKGYSLFNDAEDIEAHNATIINAEKKSDSLILYKLSETIKKRKRDMPSGSYTTHLFEKGMEKIKKKIGEEAIELILAESKEDIIYEAGDLIYHLLVMLEQAEVSFHDLMVELESRDK